MKSENKRCPKWAQMLLRWLVLYLDDILLAGGCVCFVRAAWEGLGRPMGLAVAGACLCGLALMIARAKRGGERG